MAESGLDSLRDTHNIKVERRAFELRPADLPPPSPEEDEAHRRYVESAWPRVQAIARERFGLELRRKEGEGRRPTRLAHAGLKIAEAHGRGDAYHLGVFRAYWQELRDIFSVDGLAEIAAEAGLNPDEFRDALADGRQSEAVETDEAHAAAYGIQGVPAFIFGERYLVSGAQPADVLRQVAGRCVEEGRIIPGPE